MENKPRQGLGSVGRVYVFSFIDRLVRGSLAEKVTFE